MYNYVLIILPNNLVKIIMFMSNYTDMQYEKVLMTVGKLVHRDAAATANEQSPALVRVRFTSNMLLFALRSVLVG